LEHILVYVRSGFDEADAMAETVAQGAGHPAMDYGEHEKTYRMFLRLIKCSIIAVSALLVLLAVLWG